MRELRKEELENINGGVNWVELGAGAVQVAVSLTMDATGVGAAEGISGLAEMDQAIGYNPF